MSDEMTTQERLAAWLDGEAALYRERAQRAEDAQDWDPAVRYAGAADALVQLRDRVLLGEQIGPSPVMREALSSAWDKASESHTFPTSRPDEESAARQEGGSDG